MTGQELAKNLIDAEKRVSEERRAIERATIDLERAAKARDEATNALKKTVGQNTSRSAYVVDKKIVLVTWSEKGVNVEIIEAS